MVRQGGGARRRRREPSSVARDGRAHLLHGARWRRLVDARRCASRFATPIEPRARTPAGQWPRWPARSAFVSTKRGSLFAQRCAGAPPEPSDIGRACRIVVAAAALAALATDLIMISPRPEILATRHAEHGGRLALVARRRRVARAPRLQRLPECVRACRRRVAGDRRGSRRRVSGSVLPSRRGSPPQNDGIVQLSEIVFGAGAAELIYAVCFAYLRPGDHVLIADAGVRRIRARRRAVRRALFAPSICSTRRGRSKPSARRSLACDHAWPFSRRRRIRRASMWTVDDLRVIADVARSSDCLLVLDQAYDAFTAAPLGTPALRRTRRTCFTCAR